MNFKKFTELERNRKRAILLLRFEASIVFALVIYLLVAPILSSVTAVESLGAEIIFGFLGALGLWMSSNGFKQNKSFGRAQSTINKIQGIRSRLDDLPVMIELADAESDKSAAYKDIDTELDNLTKTINDLEVQTLLSGEYDDRDALVTIRSEAGGVEAADWAEMLMRMYLRFCERHSYKTDVGRSSRSTNLKNVDLPDPD